MLPLSYLRKEIEKIKEGLTKRNFQQLELLDQLLETDQKNLDAEIILDKNKTVQLKELLPFYNWWKKQV